MDSTNSAVQEAVLPVESHQDLRGMLANARNTKQMLEDFLAAIQGATVSGHVVYRLAIGIQFLETLLKQSKADIERLQKVADVKHSDLQAQSEKV